MTEILQMFRNQVAQACPALSAVDLDEFLQGVSVKTLSNKSIYMQAEEIPNKIGLVINGLMKMVYTDEDGNETNVNFVREGMFAVHYQAVIERQPSKYRLQCLEFCTIIDIPFEHLEQCLNKMPALERYVRLGLQRVLYAYINRTDSLLIQNAEKRYLDFIQNNPELFKHLSVSDLCSYLGIQRQSLTRIRKQLLSN